MSFLLVNKNVQIERKHLFKKSTHIHLHIETMSQPVGTRITKSIYIVCNMYTANNMRDSAVIYTHKFQFNTAQKQSDGNRIKHDIILPYLNKCQFGEVILHCVWCVAATVVLFSRIFFQYDDLKTVIRRHSTLSASSSIGISVYVHLCNMCGFNRICVCIKMKAKNQKKKNRKRFTDFCLSFQFNGLSIGICEYLYAI